MTSILTESTVLSIDLSIEKSPENTSSQYNSNAIQPSCLAVFLPHCSVEDATDLIERISHKYDMKTVFLIHIKISRIISCSGWRAYSNNYRHQVSVKYPAHVGSSIFVKLEECEYIGHRTRKLHETEAYDCVYDSNSRITTNYGAIFIF